MNATADAVNLSKCENLLAQCALSILTEATSDNAKRILNQAAAILRRLPTEMPEPQAKRRRQIVRQGRILRQATRRPTKEASHWQATGDRHGYIIHPEVASERYVVIHRGPPECWRWGHGPAEGPHPTEWHPGRYTNPNLAAQAAADAGHITGQQATELPLSAKGSGNDAD